MTRDRRKVFINVIAFLLLFIPISYFSYWHFSVYKVKNLLVEIMSYLNLSKEGFFISYDIKGFPLDWIFHLKKLKFSNDQLTLSIEALLIKNRFLNKSVYIYMLPNNKVNITTLNNEKKNIKCHLSKDSRFVIKLNNFPTLLKVNRNNTILNQVNTLRYEDYGLRCSVTATTLENLSQDIITEVNSEKGNYIQICLDKKLNKDVNKIKFDFYAYRLKNTLNLEDSDGYVNVDIRFFYEFINHISYYGVNFGIEKFLIQSDNFSFTAEGEMIDFNLINSSFSGKIDLAILNYKKLLYFLADQRKNYLNTLIDTFEKLLSALAEEIIDNSLKFSIKYNNSTGLIFIGKLSIDDFINQLNEITSSIKNESSN